MLEYLTLTSVNTNHVYYNYHVEQGLEKCYLRDQKKIGALAVCVNIRQEKFKTKDFQIGFTLFLSKIFPKNSIKY